LDQNAAAIQLTIHPIQMMAKTAPGRMNMIR